MKKLVIMTAFKNDGVEYEPYVNRCAHSWDCWCKKHGHDFVMWEKAPMDMTVYAPTFQRMRVFELLDALPNKNEYDEFSLVDYDTFIFPWCPDYFKLTNGEFTAVPDAGYAPGLNHSIQMVKDNWFPHSNVHWSTYFNAGFMTFSWKHRPIFESVFRFRLTEFDKWLVVNGSKDMVDDQTLLNFFVKEHNHPVNLLSRDYNVLDFYLQMMLDPKYNPPKTFRDTSKIIHLTQNTKFRNDVTGAFFYWFGSELGLDVCKA